MGFVAETRERVRPVLPLSAMLDVMFLLLIFFMTASAFRDQEYTIDVSVPATEAAPARGGVAAPIVVTVTAQGELFLGEQGHTFQSLNATLSEVARTFPDQQVLIRGDQASTLGLAVQAMDTAYAAGLTDVRLSVSKAASELE